jgi:hypothetical protein
MPDEQRSRSPAIVRSRTPPPRPSGIPELPTASTGPNAWPTRHHLALYPETEGTPAGGLERLPKAHTKLPAGGARRRINQACAPYARGRRVQRRAPARPPPLRRDREREERERQVARAMAALGYSSPPVHCHPSGWWHGSGLARTGSTGSVNERRPPQQDEQEEAAGGIEPPYGALQAPA